MIRVPALVSLAALLLAAAPPKAKESDAVRNLLLQVVARPGVTIGSLAVVPLVLRSGVEPGEGPRTEHSPWAPAGSDAKGDRVVIRRKSDEHLMLVPGGMLLEGGARERLLSRPILLGAEPVTAVARIADRRRKARKLDPATDLRATGRIAPILQRKLDLVHGDADLLADVLRVQAFFAGLGESKPTTRVTTSSPRPSASRAADRWTSGRRSRAAR